MRIAVVGTGYVGLVAGTCFAETGHSVTCVDVDEAKLAALRAGKTPIYEPGLEELLARNIKAERVFFTDDLRSAVRGAEVVFIAVGTPQGDDGNADLRNVMRVAHDIAAAAERYTVIVNKSTVPVGTAQRMQAELRGKGKAPTDVVSNPEFLKEGAAIDDFMRPDRIVIGASSEKARALVAELYAPFVRTESPIYFMDPASAELTKYAANAMLATRISFMNDVAMLCERVGADVDAVRPHEIVDGGPFLEELGIGDHVDLRLPAALELCLHPLRGAHRNGALVDDDRVPLGGRGDVVGDAHDRAQVGIAIVALRRSHGDERHLGAAHRGSQIAREEESLGLDVAGEELLETGLVDGSLPGAQRGDLRLVHVDAGDRMPGLGEAGTGDEADVSGSDDGNAHGFRLLDYR